MKMRKKKKQDRTKMNRQRKGTKRHSPSEGEIERWVEQHRAGYDYQTIAKSSIFTSSTIAKHVAARRMKQ